MDHKYYMNLALDEAEKGMGLTGSNPSVGCLLLNMQKQIIGLARTANGGRPHAEVIAIEQAKIKGYGTEFSTAYITLEPCAHHGEVSSCTTAIINAGIKKVVVATVDPDTRTNGQGLKILKNEGIEVVYDTNINPERIRSHKIIRGFISRISKNRPFISLKVASSLDGKIALSNGTSKWITSAKQREYSHAIRLRSDAILTGISTVIADDPILTCRLPGFVKQPIRIILDGELRIPKESKICQSASEIRTIIYTGENPDQNRKAELEALNIQIFATKNHANSREMGCVKQYENNKYGSNLDLSSVVNHCATAGINEIMLETGSRLTTKFLQHGLIDQIYWFYSNKIVGNDGLPAFLDLYSDNLDSYSNIPTEIIVDHELYGVRML